MLTRKQYELLAYIDRYQKKTGFSPSFEEMKTALQLHSKSGIHRLVSALEERGFVKRHHHRARALEILRLPEVTPETKIPKGKEKSSNSKTQNIENHSIIKLPLYGRVAENHPLKSLIDQNDQIEIPASYIGKGKHYALIIKGDSMINAGILDGDVAIIQQTNQAKNNDIVVALINQHEITLKRLRIRKDSIALEPENDAYETRIFPSNSVRVQGKLVSLLRHY